MNPEDEIPPPPPAPGPLEQAYLHGDVHPDDQPGVAPSRPPTNSLLSPEPHFPEGAADDVGMFV